MARSNRDEFLEGVKRVCGERAQYICSNPACRNPTIGPHSESNKSLKTGKTCHIHAAAAGGPRYDACQTPEQRCDIKNAIWLCSVCSDRVDKDQKRFSAELLMDWKTNHEDWLRNGGIIPKIPYLSLTTLHGLTLPDEPGELDMSRLSHFREHCLLIRNDADTEIKTIQARVQTPEPIYRSELRAAPAGVHVGWAPIRPQMVVSGSPGAKVARQREPLPTNVYQLQIDRLPAKQQLEIAFGTSLEVWKEHDISFDSGLWADFNKPPNCAYYLDGTYQFQYQGATLTKQFFAPIGYSKSVRQMSLIEVLPDYGKWKHGELTSFS